MTRGNGADADGNAAFEARLTAYIELLVRYGSSLDLLSPKGMRDMDALVADARAYSRLCEALAGPHATVVDVGSGSGLPGMVVALALPGAHVYLVERRRRRAAFLELAASRLGLQGVSVFPHDVRTLTGVCADIITAQAVAGFGELVRLTRHLHADPVYVVSRRGPAWRGELEDVRSALGGARTPSNRSGGTRDAVLDLVEPAMGRAAELPQAATALTAAADVVAEEPLERSGSLVALRLTGGPACRSSG